MEEQISEHSELPSGNGEPGQAAASDCQDETKTYTLPGLDGEWTLNQLVQMEMEKDPRLGQVRRSALPPEFWDARRRARNHSRLQRNYGRRKRRADAMRQEEEERLAGMDETEQAAYVAQREAEREAAKAAAATQRERVAAALDGGLRVVVDCSLSVPTPQAAGASSGGGVGGASDREVRSLCKQLELCAAANKRAARPVSLQFASFTGRVRTFAEEAMNAERWPAARGHEAPLAQLFPADQLVVLSPDAAEPLEQLEEGKVYVIGGLVDRTVQKGASLRLAQRCGAQAVRLPIAEHLGPLTKGKGVLNVNDVFAALLAVHAGQDWRAALEAAVPQRFRAGQPSQAAGAGQPTGTAQAPAAAAAVAAAGAAVAATTAAPKATQAAHVRGPAAAAAAREGTDKLDTSAAGGSPRDTATETAPTTDAHQGPPGDTKPPSAGSEPSALQMATAAHASSQGQTSAPAQQIEGSTV